MKKLAVLDDFLVRDYLIKILGEGEEFAQEFYKDLLAKSLLFQKSLSKERLRLFGQGGSGPHFGKGVLRKEKETEAHRRDGRGKSKKGYKRPAVWKG
jgi:hypothetical protein